MENIWTSEGEKRGDWIKLPNEDLPNLLCSPNVFSVS